ncbi:Fatty acid/phospholipid biosynthesis enzyme [Frankia canadensis]|uniref:phosphate acyltransferase n=1 Tax=Frankia canadensis TaxID=1836972 RepID=A0A2I2KJ97_9ACTN|nr:phosphate starvation-inducible protein PhoH [Frankia canadensis]SNQ45741.1 Fatty acid/phospholipid biosynthesis enzyme [Frankia canadensis]SOU53031.1 Fatty acid/phospholipid biosynthesis enzyme [Frankia canadensis]
MTRIAVDLLGEGLPAGPLLEALPTALDADPRLVLILVAAEGGVEDDLARLGIAPGERVLLRSASQSVDGGPQALRDVRGRRGAGVRVAARLVRDGEADAMVSVAPVESVLAAAQFTYGLLPGATRAVLASVVGEREAGVVLCDAGGGPFGTADEFAQSALLGGAYAALRFSTRAPRVGLLTARVALVDPLRDAADEALRTLDLDYLGPRTPDLAVATAAGPGRELEVVVTDGYTGDIVLSVIRAALERRRPRGAADRGTELDPAWGTLEDPEVRGGTIVLGVDGVAVHADRGEGGSVDAGGDGLLAALRVASLAVRGDLCLHARTALATLVARRRARAGLVG